jgi:hypothetical protein
METLSPEYVYDQKAQGMLSVPFQDQELQILNVDYDIQLLKDRYFFINFILNNSFTTDGNPYRSSLSTSSSGFWDYYRSTLNDSHSSSFSPLLLSSHLHIYSVVQSLMKMHPLFDFVLLHILSSDPLAIILFLKNPNSYHYQHTFQQRLTSLASQQGISLQHRVFFLSPMKHQLYSTVICNVDVVLDTFPFGGGVTMCDAVGGSCSHRRSEVSSSNSTFTAKAGNRYASYDSVPFITISELQSVHPIGKGIAKKTNDSSLARIVTNQAYANFSLLNESSFQEFMKGNTSFHELFRNYSSSLMNSYVTEAIDLAELSVERFRKKMDGHSVHQDRGREAYHAIYESEETGKEFSLFFQTLTSGMK